MKNIALIGYGSIGKKIFTEKKFFSLHKKLKDILEKKNIYFDDVQYSPYHINSKIKKFKKNSNFRKPGNLMIEKIKNNWDIDLKKSFDHLNGVVTLFDNLNIKIMFGVELVHLDESNPTNVGICREYRGIYREY